jgi:hypothetical protein
MQSLDLVCQGPIHGPVKRNGADANGLDILEAVYYNNNPIKEPSTSILNEKNLKFENIQLVDRLNTSSIALVIDNINSNIGQNVIDSDSRTLLIEEIQKNENIFANFGIMQFNSSGVFETGDGIYIVSGQDILIETLFGTSSQKRFVDINETKHEVPSDFSFVSGIVDTSIAGVTPSGQVAARFVLKEAIGGGAILFFIGDNVATGSNGTFETGKFLFSSGDSSIDQKIQSGISSGYDSFVYDGSGFISFASLSSQVDPAKGETIGQPIKLSIESEVFHRFNFQDASIEFTNGSEFQSKMTSYSRGERQINIGQELLGPFRLGGQASEGVGNLDRGFSTWQTNLPLPYDEYPYQHIIEQNEVKKVIPTVAINSLSDTQDAGEGVGRTLAEFVEFKVDQGFEGDDLPVLFDDIVNANNAASLEVGFSTFKVSSSTGISGFVSGLGPIYLRDNNDSLQSLNVGSSLTGFGIDGSSIGKLFSSTTGIDVVKNGSGYTGIESDLSPEILNYGEFQRLEFENALTTGTSGIITGINQNFGGGLFGGAIEVAGQLIADTPITLVDIPNVDKNPQNRVLKSLQQGLDPSAIFLAEFRRTQEYTFQGIVSSPYLVELSVDDLPDNRSLKGKKIKDIVGISQSQADEFNLNLEEELFPGSSWKNVNRFVKVGKKTFETESVLINREVGLAYLTERIDQNFTYPYSAMFGNVIDARTFSQPPERTFDLRLKKCSIPSNYSPLNADGTDKRFVSASSRYGLRNIHTFNGSTYIKVPDKIDLGTENYEISFKVKFGSFNTTTTPVYFIDVDGGNLNTPGRVAVYHRDNGGGSSPEIGMVGVDDAGNTDFSNKDIDISAYSTSDVFTVSLKAVGSKYTLTVKVGETLVGTETGTLANRPSFSYDPVNGKSLLIGAETTKTSSTFQDNGTQIADYKIKKNNQLLHHWDGTVINTTRFGDSFKDKFGGNHGEIVGTANAVEDTNFEFGRNKEQIYIGEWDGSFKLAWTDNPAWILFDLMTNKVNGLGSYLDDFQDIDIFHLYEMGRHCDAVDDDGFFEGVADAFGGLEPRFSANFIINDSINAFEVIGNVASVFRAITYWQGGVFNFSIDKPKNVSAIFNNGNVFDGSFTYADIASTARYTRVEVPYLDKNDDFKIKVEYVEDEEKMRKYGKRVNEQNGFATTSKSQARRIGKYILFSNQFETEAITFQAGAEALLVAPGDIIRVDDEIKNFEINYGKILDINTGEGYLDLEKSFLTGSVLTGDNGGLFIYNSKEQKEIKDLYDLIDFNQTISIGEDQDIYSGRVPLDEIDKINEELITKYQITGMQSNENSNRVFVDQTKDSFEFFTGCRKGSFFNIELTNEISEFYKVIKISESENNLYEIQGLQYETGKFEAIENEDIDIEQNNYNIGIPENTINRPPEPQGFTVESSLNVLGGYNILGTITGAVGGNETKYRVSLISPNGSYETKDVLKNSSSSPPETNYIFENKGSAGNYKVSVTSLRNPESSSKLESKILIPFFEKIMENFTFSKIESSSNKIVSFNRLSETECKGAIVSENENCVVQFKAVDCNGLPLKINQISVCFINVYIKINSEWEIFEENLKSETFEITKNKVISLFGEVKRDIDFLIELCENDQKIHDKCFLKIQNSIPEISSVKVLEDFNKIKFNINLSDNTKRDLSKVNILMSKSDTTGFENLGSQKVQLENFNGCLELPKEDFLISGDVYDTGINYFKFLPYDSFGSGKMSEVYSGKLKVDNGIQELEKRVDDIEKKNIDSISTVYIANGTGSQILNSSNQTSGIYMQKDYQYIIDLGVEFDCFSTGENKMILNLLSEDNVNKNSLLINHESNQKEPYYKTKKAFWSIENDGVYNFLVKNEIESGNSLSFNFEVKRIK